MHGSLKVRTDFRKLDKLIKQNPKAFKKAFRKGAIQFLTWANTGQGKTSRKPPIRWGVLRASSSAFVGNELVEIYNQNVKSGASESPTPARTYSPPKADTITWVWNTDYAAKMHEWKGGWGEFTRQDGDAGNKWLEKHLLADKNALIKMIAEEFKKESGL